MNGADKAGLPIGLGDAWMAATAGHNETLKKRRGGGVQGGQWSGWKPVPR
jgi:hypothetical protein